KEVEIAAPRDRRRVVVILGDKAVVEDFSSHAVFGASRFAHSVITASASISTSISGEISLLTSIIVIAGRIAPKNSPWALPTFSHSAMLVTYMRVRTTSFS